MTAPRRIRVVGNSGAGKTTFARALAARMGVPHLELDAVFWSSDWVKRDVDEALGLVRDFRESPAASPGWVVDGNWANALGDALDEVEAWVWLDYGRRVTMPRVLRRTLWRGATRAELWHGNREDLRNLLSRDPHRNVVLWSWTAHSATRERYTELARTSRVIRLRTPRDARRWLSSIR